MPIDTLKRLGGGVLGLAQNPTVQGALGAAAFGANPLLGLLIGPALQNKRDRAELENQELRQRVTSNKRRLEAQEALPGLLEPIQGVGTVLSPEGAAQASAQRRSDLIGALGTLSPDATANSVLGQVFPQQQQTRTPTSVAEFRALQGMSPQEQRAFLEFQQAKNAPDETERLQREALRLEINSTLREERQLSQERADEELAFSDSVQDEAGTIMRLFGALDRAEEATVARPGGVLAGTRRTSAAALASVADFFGADELSKRFEDEVTAFDDVKKESAVLVGNMLQRLNAQGINVTRGLQDLIESGSAGEEISIGTSRSILKVGLETILREADRRNIRLKDRRLIERRLAAERAAPLEFMSISEAEAAARAGALADGDKIVINGRSATWRGN